MWPLANRLGRNFDVVNWSYFSFAGSVERHAERHAERLSGFLVTTASQNTSRNIHLVAHSMGSIVARAALSMATPANFGPDCPPRTTQLGFTYRPNRIEGPRVGMPTTFRSV